MQPNEIIAIASADMKKAIEYTIINLNLHTGKASPAMLDSVKVKHGAVSKLKEVAAVHP